MSVLIQELRKASQSFRAAGATHNASTMDAFINLIESPEFKGTPNSPSGLRPAEQALRPMSQPEGACAGEPSQPKPHFVSDHLAFGLNACISIEGRNPGAGGAFTQYLLLLRQNENHPASRTLIIDFQSKPVQGPDDFNGFTNEALLAVVIDRLRSFQQGPYSCRENSTALTKVQEALHWLQARSRDRAIRGVEGTHAR